jgi:hypothetical protein
MNTKDTFIPFAPQSRLTGLSPKAVMRDRMAALEREILSFEQFQSQAALQSAPSPERGRFTSTGVWLSLINGGHHK